MLSVKKSRCKSSPVRLGYRGFGLKINFSYRQDKLTVVIHRVVHVDFHNFQNIIFINNRLSAR